MYIKVTLIDSKVWYTDGQKNKIWIFLGPMATFPMYCYFQLTVYKLLLRQ